MENYFYTKWRSGIILTLQAFAFCAQADINASVDVPEITIGDIIKYKVVIILPAEAQIKDPFTAEGNLGEFGIRDFKWSVEQDKAQTFHLEYALSIFKTGGQSIPAYKIEYRIAANEQWQEISAKAVDIKVQSVLGDAKEPVLKPLKPRIIIWKDHLLWIIVLVLLGAVLWTAFKFWQKKQKTLTEKVVVEPAHVIAYRELDQLKRADLIARGLMDEYYEKLSGCIRRYLENRFFLRAPWMSTEEFLKEVKTSPVLSAAQRTSLKDFLSLSDLVKFACYGSSAQEAAAAFAGARSFIDQTKQEEISETS